MPWGLQRESWSCGPLGEPALTQSCAGQVFGKETSAE